jgi:sec-independent protein translocase protein TatA
MFNLGFPELMVILVIALVVFGPGKMPELGNSLGKAIRGFKKAMSEEDKDSADSKKPDQR